MDEHKPTKRRPQPKSWLADLNLTVSHRDILLSTTAWMTDPIINAAQNLLREQYPNVSGLQNVNLGQVMVFVPQEGEFLQILNTGHNHWITISTIGLKHPVIRVFDSLRGRLPTLAKAQIASLLCTQSNCIEVQIMKVQIQVS